MRKKDLSVLNFKKLNLNIIASSIYFNFNLFLKKFIKKKNFLIAVSGGPDSLALTALSKTYSNENKNKVFFVLINHGIRSNS
jgi:tRNA(Ile)-lysidine synthase